MDNSITSRRRNGESLGFSVSEYPDGWDEYRSLSASVNRACSKWLEGKLGYKPTFGGMRYGKGKTPIINPKFKPNEDTSDPSIQ